MLVLALGGWLAFGHRGPKANAAAAIPGADEHRLAILYFQHPAGDSTLGYLADGLSEDLIAQLGRISGIAVISRNGVAPYRARPAPAESIAAALKVGLVVNGKVDRDDDKVRVRLTLIDGPTGTVLDSASLEQAAANPLALRDSLAVRATMLIRRRVGDAVQLQQRRSSTNDPAAWELAQRGDALTRQADSLDAAGDAAGATQAYDEADSLLAVAQARDPKWDQPLVLRGRIAYDRSRRDGADATAAADWVARGLRLADAASRPSTPKIRMRLSCEEPSGTGNGWSVWNRTRSPGVSSWPMRSTIWRQPPGSTRSRRAPGPCSATCTTRPQPAPIRTTGRPTPRSPPRMPTRPTPTFGTPMR